MKKIPFYIIGGLLVAEILARVFIPPSSHPFNFPIPKEASHGNNLSALVPLIDERTPGEIRILVSGGSTAYGLGSSAPEYNFSARLEAFIKEAYPQKKIRVLNGAVESFRSSHELNLFLNFSRKLKPDLLIMFSGFNDLGNAVLAQLSSNPYADVKKLEKIQYVSPLNSFQLGLLFVKSLAGNLNWILRKVSRLYEYGANFVMYSNPDEIDVMKETKDYQAPGAQKEIDSLFDVIHAFHSIGQKDGFQFAFLLQPIRPCGISTQGKIPTSWSNRAVRDLYFSYVGKKMIEYADRNNLWYMDLNQKNVDFLIAEQAFTDTCHLNDHGYDISARQVFDFLQRKKFFDAEKK